SADELICLLASLDYCAAVWSPVPSKARIVAPSCIRASLNFLFDSLDVDGKKYFSAADLAEFWEGTAACLASRGFPAWVLCEGSVRLEVLDRLQNKSEVLTKQACVNDLAPLIPGDPVMVKSEIDVDMP
ncbi:hypothetical protein EAH_00038380, partial [Eimeria acervulina]